MKILHWLGSRHPTLEILGTLVAGLLYAIALKYFVFPAKVILTGTEGIAASLSYFFHSDALFLVLYAATQLFLIAFAFRKISRTFAFRTLLTVGTVILCLPLLPELRFASPESEKERIILVLFGGILSGLAKALALRWRGSTGDEDILAAWFAMRFLKPVGSIVIIAAAVSTIFGLALEALQQKNFEAVINTLMYTSIYIFTSSETLNNFFRKFKLVMVTAFGRDPALIGQAVTQALPHRTFTVQEGTGGYSSAPVTLVRTIVTHEELPDLLDSLDQNCPETFYFHHDIEGVSRSYYIKPIG